MDTFKIRLKVGDAEFEAEGPSDAVAQQLEAWRQLVAVSTKKTSAGTREPPPQDPPGSGVGTDFPTKLYTHDAGRNLVTLKALPAGQARDADAMLLVLYGFKGFEGKDEVGVIPLKESVRVSGIAITRVDKAASGYVDAGLLIKTGRGPGGKYRLTHTGLTRAKEIATEMASRFA